MKIKGLRVPVIVIAALLTLVLLFGFNVFYREVRIEKPLLDGVKQVKEVKDLKLFNRDGKQVLRVRLGEVADLQRTYIAVREKAGQVFGSRPYLIEIVDNPSPELEKIYYNLQFPLQEALVRGNFTEMKKAVEAETAPSGVEARVYIDQENLYLQLKKGDHYLYRIFPRSPEKSKVNTPAVGVVEGAD